MNRWTGRVALVTGASAGIGSGICKALVKHGMSVVGCDTDAKKIKVLAKNREVSRGPGKFHGIRCDLTQEDDILAMFDDIRKTFGHVDVCINNAGINTQSRLASGKTEEWSNMLKRILDHKCHVRFKSHTEHESIVHNLQVNILGLCICTRESLALMKENNIEDGQIIHMGSIVGHRIPITPKDRLVPALGIYYGTKFMVRALAESLRQELKGSSSKIRVATISPGAVETEMMKLSLGDMVAKAFYRCFKTLRPNDIADAVTYILSTPPHVNVEDIIVQPIDFSV